MFPYTVKYTENPNPILKITIYCTKYANNAKILWNTLETTRALSKYRFVLFCTLYKFYNSYFVMFVFVVFVYVL